MQLISVVSFLPASKRRPESRRNSDRSGSLDAILHDGVIGSPPVYRLQPLCDRTRIYELFHRAVPTDDVIHLLGRRPIRLAQFV